MGLEVKIIFTDSDLDKLAEKVSEKLRAKSNGDKKTVEENIKTYTTREVANITSKCETTIRNHIKKGLLKASKTGQEFTITEENLKKYIGI